MNIAQPKPTELSRKIDASMKDGVLTGEEVTSLLIHIIKDGKVAEGEKAEMAALKDRIEDPVACTTALDEACEDPFAYEDIFAQARLQTFVRTGEVPPHITWEPLDPVDMWRQIVKEAREINWIEEISEPPPGWEDVTPIDITVEGSPVREEVFPIPGHGMLSYLRETDAAGNQTWFVFQRLE
jgi:hypothetical protein